MHSYRLNFRLLAGRQHTNAQLSHLISQVLSSLAPTSSTMSTPKISTGRTRHWWMWLGNPPAGGLNPLSLYLNVKLRLSSHGVIRFANCCLSELLTDVHSSPGTQAQNPSLLSKPVGPGIHILQIRVQI